MRLQETWLPMPALTAPKRSHLLSVVRALAGAGWKIARAPENGQLVRNGQRLVLRGGSLERRFRVFVYKVTGSGRQRPFERRIEITSTYQKGLRRQSAYPDVVLGIDVDSSLFVGVDPRRIDHGGPTGNASSFFDISGLTWTSSDEILVQLRKVNLFTAGVEVHAFFRASRLAEYLFNVDAIHAGAYKGGGLYAAGQPVQPQTLDVPTTSGEVLVFSGPKATRRQRRVPRQQVEAYEAGSLRTVRRRKVTPEQLLEIQRRADENGRLGEEIVLTRERRALRRAGRLDLAARVKWVSQQSVSEGFDILSFEKHGQEKWIEVKSTSGTSSTFEMSDLEWRTCCQARQKYYIYRVTLVRTAPAIKEVRNPMKLEQKGLVTKAPSGWRVTLL
jgi:hypothetical protein